MLVRYVEKGRERDYTRIDNVREIRARDFFKPEGTTMVYFRLDRFNVKAIPEEDIITIDDVKMEG